MTCNRSEVVDDPMSGEQRWYLSDGDINDIDGAFTFSEGGAFILEGLIQKGIISASLPSGFGLVLVGILEAYFGWIKYSNDGCGVVVTIHMASPGLPAVTVKSQ